MSHRWKGSLLRPLADHVSTRRFVSSATSFVLSIKIKMSCPLVEDKVWLTKGKYHAAEKSYYENLNNKPKLAVCAMFGPRVRPHHAALAGLQQHETKIAASSGPRETKIGAATQGPHETKIAVATSRPHETETGEATSGSHRTETAAVTSGPYKTKMTALAHETNVWLQKRRYSEAERLFYEKSSFKPQAVASEPAPSQTNDETAKRQQQLSVCEVDQPLPCEVAQPHPCEVVQPRPCEVVQPRPCEVVQPRSCVVESRLAVGETTVPGVDHAMFSLLLSEEKVWLQKKRYAEAEKLFYENSSKGASTNFLSKTSLASEVARARQHIKSSLECIDDIATIAANNMSVDINNRLNTLEREKADLKKQVGDLTALVSGLALQLAKLVSGGGGAGVATVTSSTMTNAEKSHVAAPPQRPPIEDDDNDDGVDLFGSDSEEEDAEAARIKEQRLAEYAARKSKKPVLIAKSNIILDVKPWDDETDMKEMEAQVRKVTTDGLVWGASKLVPLAFGIHKLQISCVVEDDKVSVDWLQETIQEIEDYVQSVDIAAFNKV